MVIGCQDSKKRLAKEIIFKIEHYQQVNKKLPASLEEIGITENEEGPVYYEQKAAEEYILWYGQELGESKIYNSKTKRWN